MKLNHYLYSYTQREAAGNKRLDIAQARSNVNKYAERYNRAVNSTKLRVRGAMLTTLLRICDAYVRQNQFVHVFTDNPAPCRLNNCMLASQLKMVKRTAINHLRRLVEAGFIEKKFRGTNADFEIWVNPAVLLNSPVLSAGFSSSRTSAFAKRLSKESTASNTVQPVEPVYLQGVKSLPHIRIRTLIEISNKRVKLVDNLNAPTINSGLYTPHTACTADNHNPDTFSCHPLKASGGDVNNQKESTVGQEKKQGAAGGAKKQIPHWQVAMVTDFYNYLLKTLYPFRTYGEDTRRKILNKIYSDVYLRFSDTCFTDEDWEKFQSELYQRVDLVKKWLNSPLTDRKAKEYPDGKFVVNPLTFLDKNCQYGFKNTAYWLDLVYKRRALIKAELELEKATNEILKDSDKLRIYRKWETRFKNKRLPQALELFYSTMAQVQNRLVAVSAR